MKKLIVLALGLGFLACQPGKKDNATLDATMENVEDGTTVYISELQKGNQPVPLDTVEVTNGKISVDLPKVDFQTIDILTIKGVQGNMLFINENKPVKATVYKDSLRRSKIEGGPANKLFSDYTKRLMANQRELMNMRKGLTKEDYKDPNVKNKFMAKQKKMQKENTAYRKKLIKENPDQLPSVFIFSDLMRSDDVPFEDMKKLYDNMSPKLKNTYIGKQIGQQLTQSEAIAIGKKAPDFSAKTPDGKELALDDALGKYTLVDFWASWCKPCRKENPNVVKVYKQYHDKGLNILGVSLDKSRTPWIKAIKKDGLDWQQISNLKFWQDPIAKKYNVRAIPANFLLDKDGKIVAKDLRGDRLEQKMQELLGDQ